MKNTGNEIDLGTRIPLPPIIPPGNLCSACWGDGKDFGNIPTPSQLNIYFSGVEKGAGWIPGDPEPIDGNFLLDQHSSWPCVFEHDDGTTEIQLWFSTFNTELSATDTNTGVGLFTGVEGLCTPVIDNQITVTFKNGTATVTIPTV